MAERTSHRAKLFISYSHRDTRWLQNLLTHLKPLERIGIVELWADTQIKTGQRWQDEIQQALDEAKVAILLISPYFLESDFIVENELPQLLSAERDDGLVVFPVLLAPSMVELTALSQFQYVNDPSKTLSEMRPADRDRLWVGLAKEIISYIDADYVDPPDDVFPSTEHLEVIREALANNWRVLNLTGRKISILTDEITKLSKLTTLYLSRNNLATLPNNMHNLSNLTTLYLARNKFTEIPISVTMLYNLRELYFSLNQMRSLPSSIKLAQHLQMLDVSRNLLTFIPSEIGSLTKLKTLNLSKNQLSTIPSEIGRIRPLQHLNLSHNQISRLPSELHMLSQLRQLDLRGNPLPVASDILEDIHHPQRILEALIPK